MDNHWTKFRNSQPKGSEDIEQVQFVQRPTLTFEHMTWKSIGNMYFLGVFNVPSLESNVSEQTTLGLQTDWQNSTLLLKEWWKKANLYILRISYIKCFTDIITVLESKFSLLQKHTQKLDNVK